MNGTGRTGKASRYMTVPQVAEILGMTDKALYNRLARGQGPACNRMGRAIRISRKDLSAYLSRTHCS